jgi:hypothetical protein
MRIRVRNRDLLPTLNALGALSQWLRPGVLALRVGQILHGFQQPTEAVMKERMRILQELAQYEDRDGERVMRTKQGPTGEEAVFGANQEEWDRRERELMEDVSVIEVPRLLVEADIVKVDTVCRKDVPNLPAVDFAAITRVMEGSAELEQS